MVARGLLIAPISGGSPVAAPAKVEPVVAVRIVKVAAPTQKRIAPDKLSEVMAADTARKAMPPVAYADRVKLTWDEEMAVGRARNEALYFAEHDRGDDDCGLTAAEVGAWVRQAEADAIVAVLAAREEAKPTPAYTAEDLEHLSREDIDEEYAEAQRENHRQFFDRKAPARVNEGPRPTFEFRANVSPVEMAEWSGFSIGVQGCQAAGSSRYSETEREAFALGNRAGCQVYSEACWAELHGDPDYCDWVAELDRESSKARMNDPSQGPNTPFAELAEANGVDFARNYR